VTRLQQAAVLVGGMRLTLKQFVSRSLRIVAVMPSVKGSNISAVPEGSSPLVAPELMRLRGGF